MVRAVLNPMVRVERSTFLTGSTREDSSLFASTSSAPEVPMSPRHRRRCPRSPKASMAASADFTFPVSDLAPLSPLKTPDLTPPRSPKAGAAPTVATTRRGALLGWGAALAMGSVVAKSAMGGGAGGVVGRRASKTVARKGALEAVRSLQKAGSKSFKELKKGFAAGSRSFKGFASAGTKSFKGLRTTLERAGSSSFAELKANLDHAGAAVKETGAHVGDTLRHQVHEAVGTLGDIAENMEETLHLGEAGAKVEDAKSQAISEFADLIEDAGDAVKFLRWASEMYQTVNATA